MIDTTRQHHEQSLATLPLIGAAVTSAILWVRILIDERKARKQNDNNQPPKDKTP